MILTKKACVFTNDTHAFWKNSSAFRSYLHLIVQSHNQKIVGVILEPKYFQNDFFICVSKVIDIIWKNVILKYRCYGEFLLKGDNFKQRHRLEGRMQKWKCRLKRGMALALATIVIDGGTNIMTMPVLAENEKTTVIEEDLHLNQEESAAITAGTSETDEYESEENPSENEKKVPQVVGDTFVWENGEVKIPVDFGDYTAEDVSTSVAINNGSRFLTTTLEENNIIISVFDFWREELESGHAFSKKGNYNAKIEFRVKPDYNEINTNNITIQVPNDETSQVWMAEQKTAKFDGTQDITFTFANGTDYYALQSIKDVQLFAWKYLEIDGERCNNFSLEENYYTYDMSAGTLSLSKDALKYGIKESAKLWVKSGEDIKDYPKKIIVNALGVTKTGRDIYYLSSISVKNPETGFIGTDGAWKIDITDYDLTMEDLGDKKTELNVSSDQIAVSKESSSVIENSALAYIKNNYAEKFKELRDNYTVSSKLNLITKEDSEMQEEVRNGFQSQLGNKETIGQYYDINIIADVLQNGEKVPGLENIVISKLNDKVTINLQIPESIRKSGRIYKMLHYNNETKKAEILKSEVKDWVISFETDSFSPYALTYSDRTTSSGTNKPIFSDKDDNQGNQGNQGDQGNTSTNQPNNTNQPNTSGNQSKDQNTQNNSNNAATKAPKTADNNMIMFNLILMLCSIGGLVGFRRYKYCK